MTTLSSIITPTNIVTATSTTTLTNKTLTNPKVNGSSTVGGKVDLLEASNNGTNFIALKAPDTLASDVTFTLPSADGTSGQVLSTNGSGVLSFATAGGIPNVVRSARTSNTILGTADKGTLIAITSGTFTQTFTAAATLGSGWWCYIQNSGTGEITLDPNSSETIDGLTSYIMYPNEVRLVQCDGSNFFTVVIDPFYATFTATGTFTKPPGYASFSGVLWGGGGGGFSGSSQNAGGGGGGAGIAFMVEPAKVGSSETVTIGSGGSAGNDGGTSSFGSLVNAYGGGGGTTSGNRAGRGGGAGSAASTSVSAGSPRVAWADGTTISVGIFGGSEDSTLFSLYGGASGGPGASGQDPGGKALFGGGGGGGGDSSGGAAGGTSLYGGNGGASVGSGTATAGTAPGGGGGGSYNGTGGAGGNGALRIWGIS